MNVPRTDFLFSVDCVGLRSGALLDQAVLNDNAQVDKGDNARLSSFVGAIAIADLVKTTLGPKGGYMT